MPIKTNNIWTSPFEELHNIKLEYRNLHPIISIVYIKCLNDGKKRRLKGTLQNIKGVLVGNDPKLDGTPLYLPHTKSLVGSVDYKLNPSHPSGSSFSLNCDEGIHYSLYVPDEDKIRSPFYNQGDIITIQDDNNKLSKAKIIDVPITTWNPYTIRYLLSGNYDQVQEENIFILNNIDVISTSHDLQCKTMNWVKYDAKVTYFFPECMKKHKQGFLLNNNNNE